jgi:hypothetical protein
MAEARGQSSNTTSPDLLSLIRVITTINPDTGVSFFNTTFNESLPVVQELGGSLFRVAYVSDRPATDYQQQRPIDVIWTQGDSSVMPKSI